MKQLDVKALADQAHGNWSFIMKKLAPEVDQAAQLGPKKKVDCPFPSHNGEGKKDFRVFKDFETTGGGICTCGARKNGFFVVQDRNNWDFRRTLEEIDGVLNGYSDTTVAPMKPRLVVPKEPERKPEHIKGNLARIVKSSFPSRDTRASKLWVYYLSRGLNPNQNLLNDVWFSPEMAYYDEDMKKLGVFQAQSAIVRNHDGEAVSIHRTYLSDTCASKADVPMPKKLTESWKELNGAAIRLGPAQECLSIAEGIETALAVSSATGATCWAAISASILQNFVPPEGVKRVIIWADKDRSGAGEYSARVLKDQLWAMGIPTMIMLPKSDIPEGEKSIDWLDVVANQLEDIPYLADMKVAA